MMNKLIFFDYTREETWFELTSFNLFENKLLCCVSKLRRMHSKDTPTDSYTSR